MNSFITIDGLERLKTILSPHDKTKLGMVAWTDGGYRDGNGGTGIHAYIFINQETKKGHGCKGGVPTIIGYDYEADKSEAVDVIQYFDFFAPIPGPSSSTIAEMMAFIFLLEILKELEIPLVRVYLDSADVLNGTTNFLNTWAANNWRKADNSLVRNKDLWMMIHDYTTHLKSFGCVPTLEKVKAHSGDAGNTYADRNATKAVMLANAGVGATLVPFEPKTYWNPEPVFNPMFAQSRLYLFPKETEAYGNYYSYFQGNLGAQTPTDQTGRRLSNASFSVIMIKEEDPLIKSLAARQRAVYDKITGQIPYMSVVRMDIAMTSKVYANLLATDCKHLFTLRGSPNLMIDEDKTGQVTEHIDPPLVSLDVLDYLHLLERRLKTWLETDWVMEKNEHIVTQDITEIIYERVENKDKVVTKVREVPNDILPVQITAIGVSISLIPGHDLPSKRQMAAFAKEPSVSAHLIAWFEGAKVIRYATIFKLTDSVGIWGAGCSNIRAIINQ